MICVKYAPHLLPKVLSGEKTTTWRLDNEKPFEVGGRVGHCRIYGHSRVSWIIDTVLGEGIDAAAHEGHEDCGSAEERIDTYRGFYGPEVDGASEVTAIHFGPLLAKVFEVDSDRVTIVINADEE